MPGAWCCAVACRGKLQPGYRLPSLGRAWREQARDQVPAGVIAITTQHIVINLDILQPHRLLLLLILDPHRVDPVSHASFDIPDRYTDCANTSPETRRHQSVWSPSVCLFNSKCALGSRHPRPVEPPAILEQLLAAHEIRRITSSSAYNTTSDPNTKTTQSETRWRGDEGPHAPAP